MVVPSLIKKYKIIIGVAIVVIIAAAPAVYYFKQYQMAQMRLTNPTEAAKLDVQETIAAVSKLMFLPSDEQATVAQVTDVTKLKDQPFFKNAKNGDKVLIYVKAKKAILYRPDVNKIIDVAPVNIGSTTPTPQATPSGDITPTHTSTPTPTPKAKSATSSGNSKQ